MEYLTALLEGLLDDLSKQAERFAAIEDRLLIVEQGGGGGNGGGGDVAPWRLLSAPVPFSGDAGDMVLLSDGEIIEANVTLNGALSGAGLSVRMDPQTGIPGTWENVLEIGLRGLQHFLVDRWSGYMRWNIGVAYAFQGSGGKYVTHSATALITPWEDDGVKIGFRFASPEISGKPGEPDVHVQGEKPLAPRMPWFVPPWNLAKNDIIAATFVL